MLWIDLKYVSLLSYKLRNFKQKSQNYWNFSCPICGDSKKDPRKARGYVLLHKNILMYKCHNCGLSCNFGNLIKRLDGNLYSEYVLERYKENPSVYVDHTKLPLDILPTPIIEPIDDVMDGAQRIDTLPITHPALSYIVKRKIPREQWNLLYFAPKFKKFTNGIKKQFSNLKDDHPRLIIPFFTKDGKCFAFQARAFGDEIPKYYTIKLDENEEKIYGLDRVDFSKRILVVEGPIDSLFIPNCIAVSGASFDTPTIRTLLTNATIIMDNEPRNKEIVKQFEGYINSGFTVCIWPDSEEDKDINDMIKSGKSSESILETINNNTYTGIPAKLRFNNWRKC